MGEALDVLLILDIPCTFRNKKCTVTNIFVPNVINLSLYDYHNFYCKLFAVGVLLYKT